MERFHEAGGSDQASASAGLGRGARATWIALAATLAVCAASPLLAVATGDGTWYALPLFVGMLALWRRGGLTRREMGLTRAKGFYRPAALQPLLVVGAAVWLATALSATRVADTGVGRLTVEILMIAGASMVGTLFAEDGFFRGALWGALERAGRSTDAVLLWTSAANAVWFLPLLRLEPALAATPEAAMVHVLNVWLLAMSWGVLRLASGSVLAAAWAHGLWNGLAYTLFGFGPSLGALAVTEPLRFDPERGWAGVALNAAAFLILWRWWQRHDAAAREAAAEARAKEGGATE